MSVKINLNVLLGAIVILILAYLPFHLTKDLRNGGGADKAAVEKIVEGWVMENPKVIDEAMRKYFGMPSLEEEKAMMKTPEDRAAAIRENKDALNDLNGAVIMANANGTINMIEFMDYNCPFCRKNVETMRKISEDNKNVRWILKPIPPMGGLDAAKATYAANLQGKEKAKILHDAILKADGSVTKEKILEIAKENGLDVKRLEKDMDSAAVNDELSKSQKLFEKLGGGGVPSIVIGETFVEGAYPEDTFLAAIEKAK